MDLYLVPGTNQAPTVRCVVVSPQSLPTGDGSSVLVVHDLDMDRSSHDMEECLSVWVCVVFCCVCVWKDPP